MSSNKSTEEQDFEFDWIQKRKEVGLVDLSEFAQETGFEKLKRKFNENPLVPIGAFLTTCCLTYGLISMRKGDRIMSQRMMRGRILAQGLTVAALLSGIIYKAAEK